MDTKRFRLDTALTLIAAYLGLFVGLIDANSINLALPAIRDSLGRAVHDRFLSAGWVKRVLRGRALTVTEDGRSALADAFGIDWSA